MGPGVIPSHPGLQPSRRYTTPQSARSPPSCPGWPQPSCPQGSALPCSREAGQRQQLQPRPEACCRQQAARGGEEKPGSAREARPARTPEQARCPAHLLGWGLARIEEGLLRPSRLRPQQVRLWKRGWGRGGGGVSSRRECRDDPGPYHIPVVPGALTSSRCCCCSSAGPSRPISSSHAAASSGVGSRSPGCDRCQSRACPQALACKPPGKSRRLSGSARRVCEKVSSQQVCNQSKPRATHPAPPRRPAPWAAEGAPPRRWAGSAAPGCPRAARQARAGWGGRPARRVPRWGVTPRRCGPSARV